MMHPLPIPMVEVVQSPERSDHSSPEGPLVAAAGVSTSRGSDSAISSYVDISVPQTMRITGAKMTGLDDR